jgi:hypothetical protein
MSTICPHSLFHFQPHGYISSRNVNQKNPITLQRHNNKMLMSKISAKRREKKVKRKNEIKKETIQFIPKNMKEI